MIVQSSITLSETANEATNAPKCLLYGFVSACLILAGERGRERERERREGEGGEEGGREREREGEEGGRFYGDTNIQLKMDEIIRQAGTWIAQYPSTKLYCIE